MSDSHQNTQDFLNHLKNLDINISLQGDHLRVNGPKDNLSDALRTQLKARKPELLTFLAQKNQIESAMSNDHAIPPANRTEPIYASFAQQRLWFLDQLAEHKSHIYNLPLFLRALGRLQVSALAQSMNEIIRRHEILRTVFTEPQANSKEPCQHILPALILDVPVTDLTGSDSQTQKNNVQKIAHQEAAHDFDLSVGPLVRLRLIKVADEEHILLFHFHHTVFDGLSIRVLLNELTCLYPAFVNNKPSPLAPLPVQYADFSQWQRNQLLNGENLEQQLAFWRSHLENAPPFIDLPIDHPRPAHKILKGARFRFELDDVLTQHLRQLSQGHQATLFMTLYAAFAVFLARHTNQPDLVIGTPVANRNHHQLESLMGFFANTLALRFHVEPNLAFTDFLQQVKTTVVQSLQYQSMPFEKLVDELKVERSLHHNPLFQVMFTFQDAYLESVHLPELNLTPLDFVQEDAKFDLSLIVREYSNKLVCIFEYAADLFEPATITRMSERLRTLLQGIVEKSQDKLACLPLLSADERQTLLKTFNPPSRILPSDLMTHQLFEIQAKQHPERIAVTFHNNSLSYGKLNAKANQLAHYLIQSGIPSGALVGICLRRSPDILVSILGILKAGGAYIPLDPDYPDERLQFMLEDAQASVLITQTDQQTTLSGGDAPMLYLDKDWPDIATHSDQNPINRTHRQNLAYVIYTSGSTGQPKGVMINHHSLSNAYHAYDEAYQLSKIKTHLQMANYAFDVFTGDWVRALCSGGRLVLCPGELLGSPEELYQLMRREQVEFAEFVPAVIRQLNAYLQSSQQRLDFMKGCVISSDTCYMKEYRDLRALCSPQTRVISAYGVTEATIDSTYAANMDINLPDDAVLPIGAPMANTHIYLLDDQQNPVPIGVKGEIYIGGSGVAQGYLNRPTLTAEKFLQLTLNGATHSVYRSGDAARWRADGGLDFMGRLDNQVKLRGLRIELSEIETALLRHAAVKEAVTLMLDKDNQPFLVAYIVLADPLDNPSYALRAWLEPLLPNYMLPSYFIVLDAFPLTPNGKINRQALPAPDTQQLLKNYVAPRDSLELRLTLLWEKILEKSPVSIKDNFFAIGGDSLLSIRLIANIHQEFGMRIPVHTIFQNGSIEQLASLLRQGQATTNWSPLVCLQPQGEKPPIFCVHAAGGIVFRYLQVASLLGNERPFYGIQARGIEPGDAPYDSIEDMADDYVKAIRAIQPAGPYLLAGWSFGGTVAFAMARQLEQAGEQVPHLIMIDASSPYTDNYEQDDVEFLLERLRPAAGLELKAVYEQDSREAQLLYLFKEQKFAGLLSPDIGFEEAELRLKIHMHHNKILCDYRPSSPFNGKITFFKPTEKIPFDVRMGNPASDWVPFARRGIETHEAPGNHFTMFSPANGPILAQKMKTCLEQTG